MNNRILSKIFLLAAVISLVYYFFGQDIFSFKNDLIQRMIIVLYTFFIFSFLITNEFGKKRPLWLVSILNWLAGSSRLKTFIFLLLAIAVIILLPWAIYSKLIWIFLLGGIIFSWDPRISFTVAFAYLIVIPILVAVNKTASIETLAIYAYYFLLIGLVEFYIESLHRNKTLKN